MVGRRLFRLAHDAAPGDGTAHRVQLVEQRQQQQIVARLGDGAVEDVVLRLVVLPVRRRMGALHGHVHVRQARTGSVDGGFLGDGRLDGEACPHHPERGELAAELDQRAARAFAIGGGGDEGALADMAPDGALALQRVECLAQRAARHAELIGQFALRRQPAASLVAALGNEGAQPRDRVVDVDCLQLCKHELLRLVDQCLQISAGNSAFFCNLNVFVRHFLYWLRLILARHWLMTRPQFWPPA